ncbi:hypothetical protein D3C74_359750 [compost metagenome]
MNILIVTGLEESVAALSPPFVPAVLLAALLLPPPQPASNPPASSRLADTAINLFNMMLPPFPHTSCGLAHILNKKKKDKNVHK